MKILDTPIKDATRAINQIAFAAAAECKIPTARVAEAEAVDVSEAPEVYVPDLTGKIIVSFASWRSERDRAHDDGILAAMMDATQSWGWEKTGEGDGIDGPITIYTLRQKNA